MRLRWDVGLGRDLGLAFWAMTLFEATFGAYTSIWPLWIEDRGAPIALVGLVLGSAGFIRPFIIGPSSWLTERFDRKRLLIASRICGMAGLTIAAFAQVWQILFVTVLLNAMSEIVFPVMQTYVAERAVEDRARAFSMVINVGPSIALIFTPLISGALVALGGMQLAFFLGVATSFASILVMLNMDLSLPPADETAGETTRGTYQEVLAKGPIRNLLILHGCSILALAIGVTLVPNFLKDTRGMDAAIIATLGAGAAVGTLIYGLLVSRTPSLSNNPLRAAAISCAATAVGLIIFAFSYTIPWIAFAFLLRGGMFATWAMLLAEMGEIASARLRSRAFAVMEILGGSAMSIGPILAAQLYRVDPATPVIAGAMLGGVMAATLGIVHWRRLSSAPKESGTVLV